MGKFSTAMETNHQPKKMIYEWEEKFLQEHITQGSKFSKI